MRIPRIHVDRLRLQSLRSRYIYTAALAGLLVILSPWVGQLVFSQLSAVNAERVTNRNQIVHYSRAVSSALWETEYALLTFHLFPSDASRAMVFKRLQQAQRNAELLIAVPWPDNVDKLEGVNTLVEDLGKLSAQAERLLEVRADATRLFPPLGLLNEEMSPLQQRFYERLSLMIDSVDTDAGSRASELRKQLVDLRHSWSLTASTLRLYLVNLLSGPSQDGFDLQRYAYDVEQYLEVVDARLLALAQNFPEAADSPVLEGIKELHPLALRWLEGFRRVHKMVTEGVWRSDLPLLRDNIHPLMSRIQGTLFAIDQQMEYSAQSETQSITDTAKAIEYAHWASALSVLAVIILGFYLFQRNVLTPIAQVARALNRASEGHVDLELPENLTDETRQLVDAFSRMHERVQNRQSALEHQAMHDALTGLPNRNLLQDRLQQSMLSAARAKGSLALIMLDLDRFKEINDTLGHHYGDVVLKTVSGRLSHLLRKSDTVARLGGDEFAVLLPGADEEHAKELAVKIIKSVERQISVQDHKLYTSASLGIAFYPTHGANSKALLKRADIAMYCAKRSNSGYRIYEPSQDDHSVSRLSLIGDLHRAIENDELGLLYQPKLDLRTNAIIGVEALLRWRHPDGVSISTSELVQLAEQTGLIRPLTQWVLATAMRSAQEHLPTPISLSVNLSVWNLQDRDLLDQMTACLNASRLAAGRLQLEITESAMMADPDRAMETLIHLHEMGIGLAVDDFGTGFSSLAYLKRLPVDELKIDRSFVVNMHRDQNDAVIVRSTIDLAHNLGIRVVAEGVETDEALSLLRKLGCDSAQGFRVGPPMTMEQLLELLASLAPSSGTRGSDSKVIPYPGQSST